MHLLCFFLIKIKHALFVFFFIKSWPGLTALFLGFSWNEIQLSEYNETELIGGHHMHTRLHTINAQQKKSGGPQTSESPRVWVAIPSNTPEMRVVMVTGAEKSPHGPPHPPWHTHTHTHLYTHKTIFSFNCPGIADVTGETMNLTYRSGDAYLGCGKPSGDVERKRNRSLVAWQTLRPNALEI